MRANSAFLGIACLVAGGVGGWLLHGTALPASAASHPESAAKTTTEADTPESPQEFAPPPPPSPGSFPGEGGPPPEDGRDFYALSLEADLLWRIESWKDPLALKPEQITQLQSSVKQLATKASHGMPPDSMEEPIAPADELVGELGSILDPEQAMKYQAWSDRRDQLRQQAWATLKQGEIEGAVLLDDSQRTKLRTSLLERAEREAPETHSEPAPGGDPEMVSDLNETLGKDIDDPEKFQAAAKAWARERIDTELDAVKDLLRPGQLQIYRKVVERKYLDWLGENP